MLLNQTSPECISRVALTLLFILLVGGFVRRVYTVAL